MKAYLIIDVGTGNLRVAVCATDGQILAIERTDIVYYNDEAYANAQYFKPDEVWANMLLLAKKTIALSVEKYAELDFIGCTSTSQREGIVLLGKEGEDLLGLPNHDHRGKEWEADIANRQEVYEKTGRKVSSLFSALKVRGVLERYPSYDAKLFKFTSISDWVLYKLSGALVYEHSQASETNLYDVRNRQWDADLCKAFKLSADWLPKLANAGELVGDITAELSEALGLKAGVPVLVGGADTQMAINSTEPALDDLVIVAGTTTPIVKVKDSYKLDAQQRTWTNSHLHDEQYILEVNAGVTGLNYQRLKQLFYPTESYAVVEKELGDINAGRVAAALGSLICSETTSLNTGGFVFKTPVNHELVRADFMLSTILDIVFSIKANLDVLLEIDDDKTDFAWICGGGAQGLVFRQLLADVLKMNLRMRVGFEQASVTGAVKLCNTFLNISTPMREEPYVEIKWQERRDIEDLYKQWKSVREDFRKFN